MFCRESLLQGLVQLLSSIENTKMRVRILRQALQIFRAIGFGRFFGQKQGAETNGEEIISTKDFADLLITVLKETLEFSTQQKVITVLAEEGVFTEAVESLAGLLKLISPKYSKRIGIDIMLLLV